MATSPQSPRAISIGGRVEAASYTHVALHSDRRVNKSAPPALRPFELVCAGGPARNHSARLPAYDISRRRNLPISGLKAPAGPFARSRDSKIRQILTHAGYLN